MDASEIESRRKSSPHRIGLQSGRQSRSLHTYRNQICSLPVILGERWARRFSAQASGEGPGCSIDLGERR